MTMADIGVGSILNFDAGISRVVWGAPGQATALPDRQQLAPSEVAATQQLDRLLQADNIDAALSRALRPAVGSPDALRPDHFEDALRAAGPMLTKAMASAADGDRVALEGLARVLNEQSELKAALDYYRDMLIAG
jgi:hypothetical protein